MQTKNYELFHIFCTKLIADKQDKNWAEFSTVEVAEPSAMHLLF